MRMPLKSSLPTTHQKQMRKCLSLNIREANCIVYETQYSSDNEPGVWFIQNTKVMLVQSFITLNINLMLTSLSITRSTRVMLGAVID